MRSWFYAVETYRNPAFSRGFGVCWFSKKCIVEESVHCAVFRSRRSTILNTNRVLPVDGRPKLLASEKVFVCFAAFLEEVGSEPGHFDKF